MVGHAPQELIDFIGYNPVIELSDKISAEEQIANVIEHIEDYQALVDKNRETAERLGSWDVRIKWLMGELEKDYRLKKQFKTFLLAICTSIAWKCDFYYINVVSGYALYTFRDELRYGGQRNIFFCSFSY